jgi:hypothetical protein
MYGGRVHQFVAAICCTVAMLTPANVGSAQVHDSEFKACVALQVQYIFDTFGKFPGHRADRVPPDLRPGPIIWTSTSMTAS